MIRKMLEDILGVTELREDLNNTNIVNEVIIEANEKQRDMIAGLRTRNSSKDIKISSLKEQIAKITETDILATELNYKYPRKNILYKGRTLPNSTLKVEVPVNNLITPNYFRLKEDLKDWGFYKSKEDHETLIPKIYKQIQKEYYKYELDIRAWGTAEIWEFPFESFYKIDKDRGLDCDSWAILQVSYYIACGIPRHKVRVVAGGSKLGGHATVYVYSETSKRWHHLNSTYGIVFDRVSMYPTHTKAETGEDKLGIKDVWFSFNDKYCWSQFNDKQFVSIDIK